jgi:hypothetical protein
MKGRGVMSFIRTLMGRSEREKDVALELERHKEEQGLGLMVTHLRVESIQEAAREMSRLLQKDSMR